MMGWVVLGVSILVIGGTLYMDWNLGRLIKKYNNKVEEVEE